MGGQAIKENADKYDKLIDEYLQNKNSAVLDQAAATLKNLQRTNENYRMVDDDFQLPVLVGRYIKRTDLSNEQKRDFLLRESRQDVPFITLIVRNLIYVVKKANPYVESPIATNLVSFPYENGRYLSSSWRDSEVGYARGRFAMTSLLNGMTLLAVSPEMKFIVRGVVLILAVGMDVTLARKTT